MPLPHDPGPFWGEVGIHGLHRQREWDEVATVRAPVVDAAEIDFATLPDGAVVVLDPPGADAGALAGALRLAPPYRAHGVRRPDGMWAVAARRIEVAELAADPGGRSIELSWDGTERTVHADGDTLVAGLPELERLGASRFATYVVQAERLAGRWWEIAVLPL